MNKEFIGKKRFYLESHPETYVDVRVYVVETRQSEYFMAILEDGNAYTIEHADPPCEQLNNVQVFTDLNNRVFIEYPVRTAKNIKFLDRKNNIIGTGELSVLDNRGEKIYMGEVLTSRSFKYKAGWNYEVPEGTHLEFELRKYDGTPGIFGNIFNENIFNKLLFNKAYQLSCLLPEGF